MIVALLIISLIITLGNLIFLKGSIVFSIFAILAFGAGLVIHILQKKLQIKWISVIPVVCLIFGLFLLANTGQRSEEQGIRYYEQQVEKIRDYLTDGKLDKALSALEQLEQQYGSDDNTRMLHAIRSLEKGNYEEAYTYMNAMNDRTSQWYYAIMERAYMLDSSEESVRQIYALYLQAAKDYPDWTHMQKYAGITQFEKGEYNSAEYYLLRALKQDKEDDKIYYYLGAVKFYQNDYENSRIYFNEALEKGADDTTKSNILWYVEQMNQ